jgi:hypothetical protein
LGGLTAEKVESLILMRSSLLALSLEYQAILTGLREQLESIDSAILEFGSFPELVLSRSYVEYQIAGAEAMIEEIELQIELIEGQIG